MVRTPLYRYLHLLNARKRIAKARLAAPAFDWRLLYPMQVGYLCPLPDGVNVAMAREGRLITSDGREKAMAHVDGVLTDFTVSPETRTGTALALLTVYRTARG